jgi:4-amino-4-deoxy-L-arabinose transferase-like glycosyltransferase
MSVLKRLIPYLLILAGMLLALGLNKRAIRSVNPSNTPMSSFSLTDGGTIWSVDNIGYNRQFSNWMDRNTFSMEAEHPEFKVRRTPVYPLFMGIPLYYFGEHTGFVLIYILQILLHLLATCLFGQMVLILSKSQRLKTIGLYLYGLCPFIFIYVNYTITESLTPFFVTMVLYCFVRYCFSPAKTKWLILTGVVLGIATLHRPLLIFYALPLGLYVCFRNGFISNLRRQAAHSTIFALAFAITLSPWIVRNYMVAKEFIITEKWYYEDPMFYGRSHTYLRTWVNSFSNQMNELSTEVLVGQLSGSRDSATTSQLIENYISHIPAWVFTINDRQEVEAAMKEYAFCQRDRLEQTKLNPNIGLDVLGNRPCEFACKGRFSKFAAEIRRGAPLKYYILIPGRTLLRDGIAHSFSSAWAMLNAPFLSKWLVNGIKSIFFLFNVTLWISVVIYLLRRNKPFDRKLGLTFIGAIIIFTVFHIFIFRYFESRYFLPFYPILLLFFVCNLNIIPSGKKPLAAA